ncbi:hypothetical protein ACFL2E_12760 [Thermodesulfobacteriota bacterium]
MFNFRKKKVLTEQLANVLLKGSSNTKRIVEDLRLLGFGSCSDKKSINEMVILNIYCSYLAIRIYFQNDEKRSRRLRRLLINNASEVFTLLSDNQAQLLTERLNEYAAIFQDTEVADEYYQQLSRAAIENFNEDYSDSKVAKMTGKILGKIESDKDLFSKFKLID